MTIDLTQLPAPAVIEPLDYEQILTARKQRLIALYPAEQQHEVASQLELDSDPRVKLLQESSYRELILRERINAGVRAVLLAYSSGSDLENLAAFYGVRRLLITPENTATTPPTPAVWEADTSLRSRTQLAMEGFSTAGPAGAYRFHALSADGAVKDVAVDAPRFARASLSPELKTQLPASAIVLVAAHDAALSEPHPGDVAITVLSRDGDGTPSPELLARVDAALNAEDVRPLTDRPRVLAAEVRPYQVRATLIMYPGPSAQPVREAAEAAVRRYTRDMHRLGYDVTASGLYAALHQPGVQRVILHGWQDIVCSYRQAAWCTGISLDTGAQTDV
ncbi:baseplate assembly protein [Pseudomonas sp. TCU-HL1]|uniref:baseplate assembly protein n=1 Tax=Pseudomonas sp. TCU-HL1 TaxID=1856685 RepID=UPI00083D6376|nr:baseplate J/gp47 family protein [Pseudomonas sp. TCU-HL1]AOE85830.1 baseplate assembly protein [Pseudomonas sp. TCU-HL1]